MCYAMASATGIVFVQHILRMWLSVTLFTAFDGFVLVRVTFDAEQGAMFGITCEKHILCLAVAVGTNCIWSVGRIGDFKCLMGRVTGDTFIKCSCYMYYVACSWNLPHMRFVAFKAIWFVSMSCMVTCCAI